MKSRRSSALKLGLCLCFLFMACLKSHAATYYIDWANGSDANPGLEKSAAFKRHPFMNGFQGAYTHAAGDRFIFKGGVRWPKEAFALFVTVGGTDENPDYYGVDETWYQGSEFTRPLFDMGGDVITDTRDIRNSPISLRKAENVVIDNFEVTGLGIPSNVYMTSGSILIYLSKNITVRRCYVHDWVMKTEHDGKLGGIIASDSSNLVVEYSKIKAPPDVAAIYKNGHDGFTSGTGTMGIQTVRYTEVIGTTQGLWSPKIAHHNFIHDGGDSFNSGAHENGAWVQNNAEFYNNVLKGWREGVATYLLPGWGERSGNTIKFYNNLYYNNTTGNPVDMSNQSSPENSGNQIWVFNNTIVSGTCFIIGTLKSGAAIDYRFQNNLCVDTYNPNASEIRYKIGIKSMIESNNVVIQKTDATELGITAENFFRLPGAIKGVTDQGADLSELFSKDLRDTPRTGSWDVGANEYATSYVRTAFDDILEGALTSSTRPNNGGNEDDPGAPDKLHFLAFKPYFNPAHGEKLEVKFGGNVDRDVSVEIYNRKGVLVFSETVGSMADTSSATWDGNLRAGGPAPAGTYLVLITSGSEKATEKVVLVK